MPQLGWARNLLRKQTDETVTWLMYESSSVFALLWNILWNQLPGEINSDFESWLKDNKMLRMDTKGSQTTQCREYTLSRMVMIHLCSMESTCPHPLVSLGQITQGMLVADTVILLTNDKFQVYTPGRKWP